MPADQVVKVASCSGGRADYYLIGTQPTAAGCGTVNEAAQDPPTDAPAATDPPTLAPAQTPPLDSPTPSPSAQPSTQPKRR
jgi:hypothetical protein